MMRARATALLLAVASASPATAFETNQRLEFQRQGLVGDQAFAASGIENVNLFSGNLVLTLPVGSPYPVNGGFGYGFTLVYNSNVWDLIESPGETPPPGEVVVWPHVEAKPASSSNTGLGWRLSMGSLIRPTGAGNRSSTQYLYVGQDAGAHLFYDRLHADETAVQSVHYTRDGSYLRLHTDRPDGGYDVEFPDGSKQHFIDTTCTPEPPAQACPTALVAMTSTFGESVTVTGYEFASSPTVTFTDPHGRVQTVFFTDIAGEHVVDKVVLTAFSTPTAQTATYDFVYQGEPGASGSTVRRSCKHDVSPATTVAVPLLARVELPDGSHWGMSYNETEDCADPTPGQVVADRPGTLRELTLPTGGIYRYEYGEWLTFRHLDGPPPAADFDTSAGVVRRIHLEGPDDPCADDTCAWVYESISPSFDEDVFLPGELASYKKTRVTSPLGHDHDYVFSQGPWIEKRTTVDPNDPNNTNVSWYGWEYGLLLRERIYEGSAPPDGAVRTVNYGYTHDVIPEPPANSPTGPADRWYNTNRRVDWMEVSDTGIYQFVDFDGLGHFRTVDFQHGGGQRTERSPDGTVIHRATTTRYNRERGATSSRTITTTSLCRDTRPSRLLTRVIPIVRMHLGFWVPSTARRLMGPKS